MELDLDRMLQLARDGQWSVNDIAWSRPLQGLDQMSRRQRLEAGRSLLFTAGLERQAAKIFSLCAEFVPDARAAEIYRLFCADELRHAEAEVRMAARYRVTWTDLPAGVRLMFQLMERDMRSGEPFGVYEIASSTILLFELALDGLLIPALKTLTEDPVQADVFRRIDTDESRHLAMDYWLLERKGCEQEGKTLRQVMEAHYGPYRWRDRVTSRIGLIGAFATLALGFGSLALRTRALREQLMDPAHVSKYLERVQKVPKRAPHALAVPAYRMGLKAQRRLMKLIARATGRELNPA
jgi:hypothetical protein